MRVFLKKEHVKVWRYPKTVLCDRYILSIQTEPLYDYNELNNWIAKAYTGEK